jgi:hypothetical protein
MYAADITELIGNKTMTQMAAKLKVGKQAISKEANKWKDELELPQSKSMRAEEAQEHFRAAACRQHGMSAKQSYSVGLGSIMPVSMLGRVTG